MKTLSLKLQEHLFQELEKLLAHVQKSRNAYINEAVEYYNKVQFRQLLAHQLATESLLVKATDYEVFQEFDQLEDPIE